MIPTTLGIAFVVFALYHAAPGDPATVMIGMGGGGEMSGGVDRESRIEAFRIRHGLDRSLAVQFLSYVGPFNLLRDGHSWFTSPRGERRTRRFVLPGGLEIDGGEPLAIEALPGSDPTRVEWLAAQAGVLRAGADSTALQIASEGLLEARSKALPPLLSELERAYGDAARQAEGVERLSSILVQVTGREPTLPEGLSSEDMSAARILDWFRWYYTEGGGGRVRNSGERPWGGLLALDLGMEMQRGTSVAAELWTRLRVTLPLSIVSVLLSYLIALPLGIRSALRRGTRSDSLATLTLFALYSIPTFWAGLMLILAFGVTGPDWVWWPRLPIIGLHDKDAADLGALAYAWDTLRHAILPIATMTYASFAYLSRQMRAGMLEVLREDYIRTARAKGLSERLVIYRHALRNALIPVITLMASVLPLLVGGSIVVETVFDIQGMGKYAYEGLLRRDYYVVMSTTIVVGIMTQVGILVSDVVYTLVDPRIRHA